MPQQEALRHGPAFASFFPLQHSVYTKMKLIEYKDILPIASQSIVSNLANMYSSPLSHNTTTTTSTAATAAKTATGKAAATAAATLVSCAHSLSTPQPLSPCPALSLNDLAVAAMLCQQAYEACKYKEAIAFARRACSYLGSE